MTRSIKAGLLATVAMALIGALMLSSGVGVAQAGGKGHPTLSKKSVKKIAKKQAAAMVKKMAPGLSVAHATTADSAVNAQNAAVAGSVGGIQAGKFRQQVASDGPAVGLVNFAGLGLVVSCPGGYPKIYASGDGKVRFFSIDQDYGTYSNGSPDLAAFGSQGLSVLDPSAFDFGSGTIEWGTKNGATASFFFAYRWEDDTCDFFGNVLGG